MRLLNKIVSNLILNKTKKETKPEHYKSINNDDDKKDCFTLKVNLKQLEFISCFEMHLDINKEESYSLSFLEELAEIKNMAQINTIKSINYFKK